MSTKRRGNEYQVKPILREAADSATSGIGNSANAHSQDVQVTTLCIEDAAYIGPNVSVSSGREREKERDRPGERERVRER